jgi:hypothetical protein
MDELGPLPENRFNALLGRATTEDERERLLKVRDALGIRANDAVWDVMIALDHHLHLYSTVRREIIEHTDKAVAKLRDLAGAIKQEPRRIHTLAGSKGSAPVPSSRLACVSPLALGAVGVGFGAICIVAGYAMAGRGAPPWGAPGPLGAVLGAPAGWLMFVLLLPVASRWVGMGWRAARSDQARSIRAVGWAVSVASVGLIVAGLVVLAVALTR